MKTFNKPGFAKDSISVYVEFFPVAMSAILAFSIGLLQPVSAAPSTAKPKAPPNIAEYIEKRNAQLPEEQLAYTKFEGVTLKTDYVKKYMEKLSPGGKAYFLANKQEYAQALQELDKLPDKTSGSVLYVRGFCLANLGKNAEAAKTLEQAKAKIDKTFDPGFRFYLLLSSIAFKTSNLKQYAIDTATARKKLQEANESERTRGIVLKMLEKRDVASIEKSGDYKKAFDKYVVMFNERSDQLHLNDPIEADAATKDKAAAWLKKNAQPPAKAAADVEAKFYLTQGKAYLANGDKDSAKKSFEKLVALKAPNELGLSSKGSSAEWGSSLGKIKDQAKVILVRMYHSDKNFQQACVVLRQLFVYDPFTELDYWYNMVPMADVPHLVTKKDKDLHDARVERMLDHSVPAVRIISQVDGKKFDMSKAYDYQKDPMLLKARLQVDAGNFAACYETLGTYIKSNIESADDSSSFAAMTKRSMFYGSFAFSMRLYNLATGIAAGKDVGHLTLQLSATRDLMGEFWSAVDDVLQGRKSTSIVLKESPQKNKEVLSALERYCHFATAVRAMNLKDYKLAVKEFDSIKQPPVKPGVVQFMPNYTAALKKWCAQQK